MVLALSAATTGCSRHPQPKGNGREATRERISSVDRMAFVTHYHQGLDLARRFQAARALAEFESCLAKRPDHPEASFQQARMLLHVGQTEEALALLERV